MTRCRSTRPRPAGQPRTPRSPRLLGDEDPRFELVELDLTVASALRQLEPRERTILHMRFVQELTQTQIAAKVGVSQMQVSRLLRRSLDQLRELRPNPASADVAQATRADATARALALADETAGQRRRLTRRATAPR